MPDLSFPCNGLSRQYVYFRMASIHLLSCLSADRYRQNSFFNRFIYMSTYGIFYPSFFTIIKYLCLIWSCICLSHCFINSRFLAAGATLPSRLPSGRDEIPHKSLIHFQLNAYYGHISLKPFIGHLCFLLLSWNSRRIPACLPSGRDELRIFGVQ